MNRIAFIGGGNMARSLIFGLLDAGQPAASVCVSGPTAAKLSGFAERGVVTTTDNARAADTAELIVLAVKPQKLAGVLQALPRLRPDQLLISVAAGVPLTALEAALGYAQPMVRCMPNTPAQVGLGAAGLFANERVTPAQRQAAEALLATGSLTCWVDREADLDAVTALSGSGPAYVFALLEAMINSAVDLGLKPEQARLLAGQTALGAATMVLADGGDPAALRRAVTSPGGTTQAALKVLLDTGLDRNVAAAMQAAAERSRTLAQEFADS